MRAVLRLWLMAGLMLAGNRLTGAQDQYFPGAPQSAPAFHPIVPGGTAGQSGRSQRQPPSGSGVWAMPLPPTVRANPFPHGQAPDQAAPWGRPPVGPIPGQYGATVFIDRRTGLPVQPQTGWQRESPRNRQPADRTGKPSFNAQPPQPPVFPFQMSPPARRFWHNAQGYGRSVYGQSAPGFSTYGQNRFNQSNVRQSRHNVTRFGQSFAWPGWKSGSRFNQSLPNTSLHNVVVPYGASWR